MDHAGILTDPREAGIYAAPADAAPWRAAAHRAGLEWVSVDLKDAADKQSLLQAFARDLRLPNSDLNWDALSELLSEQFWGRTSGSVLCLERCEALATADPAVLEQALDVLDAVAENCYDEEIAFWVFVGGAEAADFDLPALRPA